MDSDAWAGHPVFKHCRVLANVSKQCVKIECLICGWGGDKGVTTSFHKLLYGHYLHHKGQDCKKCVARAILEQQYPEFYEELITREKNFYDKQK